MHARTQDSPALRDIAARAYTVPTDAPESDGTLAWESTTLIVAEVTAQDGTAGLGYSYGHAAAADLVCDKLRRELCGHPLFDIPGAVAAMWRSVRNIGRQGVAATAISAVEVALWDAKAKRLGVALLDLLGAVRPRIPVYGSGGFTSYDEDRLRRQLGAWAEAGFHAVKMKVGRAPQHDEARVAAAREAIGAGCALFVDANGAFDRKQALAMAERFAKHGVSWFEEPVSSDDLAGLRLLRDRAPAGMAIAAGEYGWDPFHFRDLLAAGAVDVLQADATRCGGVSGFLAAAALCEAHNTALSAHTAPALHGALCCAAPCARHLEYFHDHARIEALLFDGAPAVNDGMIEPDRTRPGLGLAFKHRDAERFAA